MATNNDSPFFQFVRRGPPKNKKLAPHKKQWYFADIGKKPFDLSVRDMVMRNLDNFLNLRPAQLDASKPEDHCCFGYKDGCGKKICTCGALFAQRLRDERTGGATDQQIVDKWVPLLEPLAVFEKQMNRHCPKKKRAKNENAVGEKIMSIEVLFHLMELAHPFSPGDKGNAVMDYIFPLGDEQVWFCHSFLWEFCGYYAPSRGVAACFMRTFLKTDNKNEEILDNNFQSYFRVVVLPKANYRQVVGWILRYCAELQYYPIFIKDKDEEATEKEANTYIKKSTVFNLMTEAAVKLSNDEAAIRQENKSASKKWWSPAKQWYGQWRSLDFFIVADPEMEAFEALDGGVLVVYYLNNLPVYGEVRHFGNAGTVSLNQYVPMLNALNLQSLENEAGWSSKLEFEQNGGYERVIRRTLLSFSMEGNPMRRLADKLKVTGLDDQTFNGFMRLAAQSCEALMPPLFEDDEYMVFGTADLLVSIRENYKMDFEKEIDEGTMLHLAQTPHSMDEATLARLSGAGIRAYSCTIPLSKDGAWLRVYPEGADSVGADAFGQMVFIPHGTMYMQPAATIHGGGFRFSFNGNRRVQLLLFFVPPNLSEEATAQALMDVRYTRKYFPELSGAQYPEEDGVYNLLDSIVHPSDKKQTELFEKACKIMGY